MKYNFKEKFKRSLPHNLNRNFNYAMSAAFGLAMTLLLLTAITFSLHHAALAFLGLCGLMACLLAMLSLYVRIEIVHGRAMEQVGQEARQQPAHLLESITDAFLAIDAQGQLTYANGPAERLLGKERFHLIGCHLREALPASLLPTLLCEYNAVLTSQAEARFECSDLAAQCWYEVLICPDSAGVSIALRNITRRKRVEEEQGRLLALLEATPDLIGINDMNGQICYFNHAGRLLLGLEEPQSGTKYMTACDASTISGVDLARVEEELFPMGVEHGVWQGEKTLHLGDGRVITVSQVVIPHRGLDGKVAYLSTIARDISAYKRMDAQMHQHLELIRQQKTELEQHQARLVQAHETVAAQCAELVKTNLLLEDQATTDGLTGLKNHRAFQQRLALDFDRSVRYHTSLSLLLLDVDKFKQYNDTFGHPAGDEVLKKVAQILQSIARNTDMVARYGGEEFVIVLPETDDEGAAEAAERIREAIAEADWDKRDVTVSVGVASLRMNTGSPSVLIEEADKALYISKEFGRNCVTHYDLLLNALVHANEQSPIHREQNPSRTE